MKSIFSSAFTFLALFLFSTTLNGQVYQPAYHIPFVEQGDTLQNAWGGGMNAPQFRAFDINRDGLDDIIVYDREDDTFTPYINTTQSGETSYEFDQNYIDNFDSCDCSGWVDFVDYDCDGLKDIFCGTQVSGVRVYRQVVYPGDSIGFELAVASLKSRYNSGPFGYIDMYSAQIDVPSVLDIDYDGDIDILTFDVATNYVYFHQNFALDSFGTCDTFVFHVESRCWGHFYEDNFNNNAYLFDTVWCPLGDFDPPMKMDDRPGGSRHTGSTILMLDLNADSLYDMLLGDVSYPSIYALRNAGRQDYAWIDSVEINYPSNDVAIDLDLFPATFYIDVDNDNIRDLIAAPNTSAGAENFRGVDLYLNKGQNDFPDFKYEGRGFLQETNIDFGSHSAPAFFDYNQDGLMDMVVGNLGYYDSAYISYYTALALLENTGTLENPAFTLVDRDYLGLRDTVAYPNLLVTQPFFGDLDGDNDDDLLVGTGLGTLMYFENVAGPGATAMFHLISMKYSSIDIGNFAAPNLYDFDSDSDLDLIIGNERGYLAFFENIGSAANANFDSITNRWGNVKINNETGSIFSKGYAVPQLMDYNKDGKTDMLVGTATGHIEIYEDLSLVLTDTFQYTGRFVDFDFGSNASPAFAIIDTSQHPTLIVGNYRGGLQAFMRPMTPSTSITDHPDIQPDRMFVYPNPTKGSIHIRIIPAPGFSAAREFSLMNSLGQEVQHFQSGELELQLDLADYPSGIYYLRIQSGSSTIVRKIFLYR